MNDAQPQRGPSTAVFVGWFLALFAITQTPLYAVQHPDIMDFANHLARFHVSAAIGSSEALQRFYELRPLQFGTNLAMDLVVPVLSRWVRLELALKVFTSLSVLALTSGAVALGRALTGRLSYLLLGVLLFAQNEMLQFGLFNFLFSAGAGLWLLAGWIASARLHWLVRWALFSIGSAALYACHLSGLGVFAIGMGAYEGASLRRTWRTLLLALSILAPIAVVHLTLTNSAGSYVPQDGPGLAVVIAYKAVVLLRAAGLSVSGFTLGQMVGGTILMLAAFIGLRHRLVRLAPAGRWIVGLLALAVFLLPPRGFGSSMVDVRLVPVVLLCFWCALTSADRIDRTVVAGVVTLAVVLLTVETYWQWSRRDAGYESLRAALRQVPEGAEVATIVIEHGAISPHAAAYAVIDRSALLSSFYLWPFQPFPLSYREPYATKARLARTDAPGAKPLAYAAIAPHFGYVLVYGGDAAARARYAPGVPTVYEDADFRMIRTQ
jgi:hypothetical protein